MAAWPPMILPLPSLESAPLHRRSRVTFYAPKDPVLVTCSIIHLSLWSSFWGQAQGAQSCERRAACSRTVWVAFSCLSGG